MRLIGQAGAPQVKKAVVEAIRKIVSSGKAAGILTLDKALQQECQQLGATFIATEIDVSLFARHMRSAAKAARDELS